MHLASKATVVVTKSTLNPKDKQNVPSVLRLYQVPCPCVHIVASCTLRTINA